MIIPDAARHGAFLLTPDWGMCNAGLGGPARGLSGRRCWSLQKRERAQHTAFAAVRASLLPHGKRGMRHNRSIGDWSLVQPHSGLITALNTQRCAQQSGRVE